MKRLFVVICTIFVIIFNLYSNQEISPDLRKTHFVQSDEIWDILFTFETSAEAMPGIETDDENIYTTTWNSNVFSRYEMDGTYLEDFTIDGVAMVRDMTYDGTYFYGSAVNMNIFIMDLANETLIGSIPVICAGISGVRHIAFDPELDNGDGGFWIGDWEELGAITMAGNQIYTNMTNPGNLYGSAYDPWSEEEPCLWLFSQNGNGAVLHQFDIADLSLTGVTHDASDIPGYIGGTAGGLATYITNDGVFAMLANIQQVPNLIGVYEIAFTANQNAPDQPTNFSVEPDVSGALEAQLSWINPAVCVNGNPLTELSELHVYRNESLIYIDTIPVIGEPYSYLDSSVPASGLYTYIVVCYNSFGPGIPAEETVWVGEDVPAMVDNLTLQQTEPGVLSGTLTWDNPITGLNGGAFNNPILGYHIIRNDSTFFEFPYFATSFIDYSIPFSGYYSYTVQPYNSIGDGGIAESNTYYIADMGLELFEDFSGATFPPIGWSIHGDGQDNWYQSTSTNAGGEAPEAMFSWTPSFTGTSRLVSYPMNTPEGCYCILEFNHYVNDYAGIYYIKVETSTDLENWHTGWEVEVTGDIGPIQENLQFTTPDIGSENLYLAFTFEGDSYNIDYWFIDDVFCFFTTLFFNYLSLYIELVGGNGNIEDVEVEIDNQILYPDSTGNIFIELASDYFDISATLENYFPAFENDVFILFNDTTFVNMELHFLEPPSELEYENISNNIALNWQAPETLLEITCYNVYRNEEIIGEPTELTFLDETAEPGLHEYYVTAKYDDYESAPSNIVEVTVTSSNVLPITFKTELTSIYPNPFNPSTTISFSVADDLQNTEITIYNLKGQKVSQLVSDQLPAGQHSVIWNSKDNSGKNVSSGIYFCKFKSGKVSQVKRILLLK